MIRVVHVRNYKPLSNEVLIRIDRGNSVLANPFPMGNEFDRDKVCDKYQAWFDVQVKNPKSPVIVELRRIYKIIKDGKKVALGCWCYPKRCHGISVMNFLNSYLPKKEVTNADEHLIITNGDVLKVTDGTILHQVNNCGKFGAGLASSIRDMYPSAYEDYMSVYKKAYEKDSTNKKVSSLLGTHVETTIGDLKIRGIFSQDGYGRDRVYTEYEIFRKCLRELVKSSPSAIYIPYGIGCGLGGGDWDIISKIILDEAPEAIIVKKVEI